MQESMRNEEFHSQVSSFSGNRAAKVFLNKFAMYQFAAFVCVVNSNVGTELLLQNFVF